MEESTDRIILGTRYSFDDAVAGNRIKLLETVNTINSRLTITRCFINDDNDAVLCLTVFVEDYSKSGFVRFYELLDYDINTVLSEEMNILLSEIENNDTEAQVDDDDIPF